MTNGKDGPMSWYLDPDYDIDLEAVRYQNQRFFSATKGYAMSGTFSNWHQQSRFHLTALPFGFVPKNPTRRNIFEEIWAARKRVESLISERIEADNTRKWSSFKVTWRPVRSEMGPLQILGPGSRVEHEEEINEMWERL